jgi:tetratricopeptide (TPR) repeat protein
MKTTTLILSLSFCTLAAGRASAQQSLKLPDPSPAATLSQTVGLTEIKVDYHRPAINKRKIWGGLVPYNEVWRAGANENTTVSFSTPVKIGGQTLPAGTYGLHMLPTQKQWTVIFSKQAEAWGSFTYDQKEDALRVTVTPQPSEARERLEYTFDDPGENGTTLSLRWEKLKVPVKIDIDTPAIVMANVRNQLRGLPQYFPQSWNQAAMYWLQHGGDLDEALKFSDRAMAMQENFGTLRTRAAILEKKGDVKAANELRARALTMATENDLNQYGYILLGQKKVDEAISVFKNNVQAHPNSWNVHDSLGEAYMAKGDKRAAAESYGNALKLVKDGANKTRIEHTLQQLNGK